MVTASHTIFYGTFVHSLSLGDLEVLSDAALVVDSNTGTIVHVEKDVKDLDSYLAQSSWADAKIHTLTHDQFLMPGFVDTHAHAPQYMFAGSGMDRQLLEWLEKYVFTCEAAYQDPEHAKRTYEKVIRRFLSNGTTTCSWFATIHLESSKILVDTIDRLGQRAYVGKVNMDQNSPKTYIEDTENSLQDTRDFIEYVLNKPETLVTPVVTPRFAITCSSTLMKGLGALAEEYKIPIQTHLCENHDEIKFTLELFKSSKDYTSVYDDHQLLNERAYMAHCVHMTDTEIDMLAEKKTGIAHCANSNFSLHSGICDVRRFMAKGVKVGLGTDVAGGFCPSMLDALRSTFFASKTNKIIKQEYTPLATPELFHLATLGGAQVLNLDHKIGNFLPEKSFDALLVDFTTGTMDLMGGETRMQKIEKFLFNGNHQNIRDVFVQGRRVAGSE